MLRDMSMDLVRHLLLVCAFTSGLSVASTGDVPVDGPLLIEAKATDQKVPGFPLVARGRAFEGEVIVRYTIDRRGHVEGLSIESEPGNLSFGRSVRSASHAWRFRPAMEPATCRSFPRRVRQRIRFSAAPDRAPEVLIDAPEITTAEGEPAPSAVVADHATARARADELGVQLPDPAPPLISRRAALFPYQAYRKRIEGYATIRMGIAADGSVQRTTVVDSEPPGVFEGASLNAVRGFRFEPGQEGAPRTACQRIDFVLRKPTPDTADDVPRSKRTPMLRLPRELVSRGTPGQVRVTGMVGTDGRVSDLNIAFSDPPGLYDRWVLDSVAKWRFEPATEDGVPITAPFERDITLFSSSEMYTVLAPEPRTEHVEYMRSIYPDLRRLCPAGDIGSDDALDRALAKGLPDARDYPEVLPADGRSVLRYTGDVQACLYSRREHFASPEVASLARQIVGTGIIYVGDFDTGFAEFGAQLMGEAGGRLNYDSEPLRAVQRFLLGRLVPAYRDLLQDWAARQEGFPGPTPAAQSALDVVRSTPDSKYDHRTEGVLESAISGSSSATDRAYLRLALANLLRKRGRASAGIELARAVALEETLPEAIRNTARLTVVSIASDFVRTDFDAAAVEASWRELNASLGIEDPLGM